ncbi:MAG: EAL domain-containing protein [Desulfuromonadaceae bacterium]|nr:EAL domain-containing protein [Desulfuromonas sp.]MDY0185182.1 EAL domain-containing protein [Desulfuromonadaceae bacterium]
MPQRPSVPQCPGSKAVIVPDKPAISDASTPELEISILVIDDEPRARQSICELLSPLGHPTTQAASVAEAIHLLHTKKFTLALVDLNLPDGSGLDIMRHIHANQIHTRLIVISGNSTFEHAAQSLRNGACDFIRKPYLPQTLLKTIAKEITNARTQHRYTHIQDELKGSESLHRFIVNTSPDMIYMLDERGNFSFVNQRVRSLLGCVEESLIGKHYSAIVLPEDLEKAHHIFNNWRAAACPDNSVELRLLNHQNNEQRFVEARAIPVEITTTGVYTSIGTEQDAEFVGIYGVIRDITEHKRNEALLQHHEHHDYLTGLPNRALLHDRLKMAMAQARRANNLIGILFLDIDRFKIINDSLGHLAGDKILQQVTQRLSTNLREGDTLARISGNEFMLLLTNINEHGDASAVAQEIMDGCSTPIHYQGQEVLLTFSIGVAIYPEDGISKEELIHNAYLAKCYVKGNSRNSYSFYTQSFKNVGETDLEQESALRRALNNGEFELYYQPQVDILEHRVIGLEALIRWNHPQRGFLAPSAFIPLAEKSDLICKIGQWVLERACQDARHLEDNGIKGLKVAINISAQQLNNTNFKKQVLQTTSHYGLQQNYLEIEITENSIMQNMQKTVEILTDLANAGIGIAIDDFGTGYSSLSYLQTLPVSTLKIDRSFIRDLSSNQSTPPIITAILTLTAALKIKCIAEGVETDEQKTVLQLAGGKFIQGYLYCRPQAFTQLLSYLRQAKDGVLNHQDQLRST